MSEEKDEKTPEAAPPARRKTGFALMTPERRKEIASSGGRIAHEMGVACRFNTETAREAGRRAHERGTAHTWDSDSAREAGRKGGRVRKQKKEKQEP